MFCQQRKRRRQVSILKKKKKKSDRQAQRVNQSQSTKKHKIIAASYIQSAYNKQYKQASLFAVFSPLFFLFFCNNNTLQRQRQPPTITFRCSAPFGDKLATSATISNASGSEHTFGFAHRKCSASRPPTAAADEDADDEEGPDDDDGRADVGVVLTGAAASALRQADSDRSTPPSEAANSSRTYCTAMT